VCSFIRRAGPEEALNVTQKLSDRLGEGPRRALSAAYRLRQVMGTPNFDLFAQNVGIVLALLRDVAVFYHNEPPQAYKVRRSAEGMTGGLSEPERARLAENLERLAEQVINLYTINQLRYRRGREAGARRTSVQTGRLPPGTGVEMLTWLGVYLGERPVAVIDLNRFTPGLMFGVRSVNTLLRETNIALALFDGLLAAFPDENAPEPDRDALATEVDNVWRPERRAEQPVIEHLQHLAQLVLIMGEKGYERTAEALVTGRIQPRTPLDALRWLSGYFAGKHSGI
jgi:hypothetical protein